MNNEKSPTPSACQLLFWSCAWTLLLMATGCGDKPPTRTQELLRHLAAVDSEALDTATQRKRAEFEKCAYVYDTEEPLRECLVLKSGWSPPDAAREIAIYKARLKESADSVAVVIRRAQAEAESTATAARIADRHRRDSVYLATHQERLDGPQVSPGGGALPWMIDTRTKAYYRSDCAAAALIPVTAREFYGYEDDARAKGWPSRQKGCR